MIQLVEKDENTTRTYVQQLKQRCDEKDRKVDAIVADILENVRNNGDKAVAEYTLKFDGSIPEQVEITKEQMKELTKQCDAYFLEALERAAKMNSTAVKNNKAGWIRKTTVLFWDSVYVVLQK